jgi:phage-related protein
MANAFTLFGEINVDTSKLDSSLSSAESKLNRTKGSLNDAGKSADQFKTKVDGAGKSTTGFSKAVTASADKLNAWGGAVAGVGAALTASITVPIVGAVAGIFALTKSTAAYGSKISDLADKTGLGAEALTSLDYAARISGASLEDVTGSVTKFSKIVGDAANGSKEASEKLERFGIKPQDAINDLQGTLGKVFARIQSLPPGVDKASAAMDLFGRSGASLLPVINSMEGNLESFIEKAKEMGLVMDDATAKEMDEFDDTLQRIGFQFEGLKRLIGVAFLPMFQKMANAVSEFINENRARLVQFAETLSNVARRFMELPTGVKIFLGVLAGIVVAIGPVIAVLGGLLMAVGAIAASITALGGIAVIGATLGAFAIIAGKVLLVIGALAAAGYLLYKAWTTNFGGIQDKVGAVVARLTALWEEHGGFIKDQFNRIWMIVKTVFDQISDAVSTLVGIVDAIFKGEWARAWNIFSEYADRTWERVKTIIALGVSYILNAIIKLITSIIPAWVNLNKRLYSAMWDFVSSIPGLLKDFAKFVWDGVTAAIKGLRSLITQIPDMVKSLGGAIVDGIQAGFWEKWDGFKAGVVSGVKNLISLGSVAKTTAGAIDTVGDAAAKTNSAFDDFLKNLFGGGGAGDKNKKGGGGGKSVKTAAQEAAEAIKGLREEMAKFGAETRVQNFDIDVTLGKYAKWTQAMRDAYRELITQRDNLEANAKAVDAFNQRVDALGKSFEGFINSLKPAQTELQKANELLKDTSALNAYAASVGKTADQIARLYRELAILQDIKKAFDEDLKKTGGIDIRGMRPTPDKDNMPGISGRRPPIDAGQDEPPPIAPWETFTGSVLDKIRRLKAEMPSFTESLSNAVVNFAQGVGDVFVDAIRNWDGTFKGFFKSVLSGFANLVQQIIAELLKVQIMKAVFSLFPGLAPAKAATGGLVKAAAGGFIRGRGTGTSDSIPAMLSNGEYVIPADMVRKFGVGFFEQIRGGMMPGMSAPMPSAASVSNSSSVITNQNTFNISVPAGSPGGASGSVIQREIVSALQKSQRRNR